MKPTITILLMLACCVVASVSPAGEAEWGVRSYGYAPSPPCERAAIELELFDSSGDLVSKLHLELKDGVSDEVWTVSPRLGDYSVAMYQVDCASVRLRVASLPVAVTHADLRKQLYVAAVLEDGAFVPRFLEVDNYRDGDGVIDARRHRGALVIANTTEQDIELCNQPGLVAIANEYLMDGVWIREDWSPSEPVTRIPQRQEARFQRGIRKYVPPGEELVAPESTRVLLAVQPSHPNHVRLGEIPRGFLGFPGCDFVYADRQVTEWDLTTRPGGAP